MRQEIQAAQMAAIAAAAPPPGPAGELATDRLLRRQALAFAVANPGRELTLTAARAYHLFRGDHVWLSWYEVGTPRFAPSAAARQRLGMLGNAYYLFVGLLAVVGWVRRPAEPRVGWRLLDVLVLTWIALFSAIYGDPRFHSVLVPPACILAAAALVPPQPAFRDDRLHGAHAG
jgi:hypothetical protein